MHTGFPFPAVGRHGPAVLLLSMLAALPAHAGGPVDRGAVDRGPSELVFQTGFEGSSRVVAADPAAIATLTSGYPAERIVGRDDTLAEKSDWARDMDDNPAAGRFLIEYTGGDDSKRHARIVPEPGNPSNHVLQFWLGDAWEASEGQRKARIQGSMYGIHQGYKEFSYQVRMYLHPDFHALESYPAPINWLTIAEYWNNEWWVKGERHGFRITLGIGKAGAGKGALNFTLNAEDAGQKEVWRAQNADLKVPIGQWFTLDCYYKEGDAAHGRYVLGITPQGGQRRVVFDVHGYTHNTSDPAPDGVTGFNPMKLYTSKEVAGYQHAQGKALQILWDDFKVWKGNASAAGAPGR